ncbi:MAG: LuxR C-terminal-related transcriptional regulator [Chloroflexota bacterium]
MDAASDLCPDLLRAFNACGDPVFVVDERWVIVQWNAAAEAAFGRAAADVRGKHCYDVLAGMDAGGRQVCRARCEKWAVARRGARVHHFDLRALPSHDVWVNVSILPISDQTGRPIALAHVVRNIERTKRLERFVRAVATSAEDVLAPSVGNATLAEPSPVHLTARELEVLGLLSRGAGTDAMAERLGVSRHTVHNHVATMLNKLGVHSRAQAVAYAFEHHIV